jgi:hypothetical protein
LVFGFSGRKGRQHPLVAGHFGIACADLPRISAKPRSYGGTGKFSMSQGGGIGGTSQVDSLSFFKVHSIDTDVRPAHQ